MRFDVVRGDGDAVYITETDTIGSGGDSSGGRAHVFHEIFRNEHASAITSTNGLIHVIIVQVSKNVNLTSFNRWYDEVHVPAVAGAGLSRARRYRDVRNPRVFMAMYELDIPEALESQAMLEVKGFGPFEQDVRIRDRLRIRRDPEDRLCDTPDDPPRQPGS